MTDEELAELALAADPDSPLDPEAVPLDAYLAHLGGPVPLLPQLPTWYMPPAMARHRRWLSPVVVTLVCAFVLIDAFGLCNTFGVLTWA